MSKGKLFIISAPAGTGKTTLVNMLTDEFPSVVRSVTCTTRAPRPNEKNGIDYYFLTEDEFQKKLATGDFLEHATVFGNHYGTSKELVEKELSQGKNVILIIDVQGAHQLRGKLDATFIFISPPNLEELKKRLVGRGTENTASLEKRLASARHELEMISHYDYHVVNDDLQAAYQALKKIIIR